VEAFETSGDRYGVAGNISPMGWVYDGDQSGLVLAWVNIFFDDGTGLHWAQLGVAAGRAGGSYQSSRLIYFEHNSTLGYTWQWVTGYPIPGNDNDNAQTWSNSYDSGISSYVYDFSVYSSYYLAYFTTSGDIGLTPKGPPYAASEAVYSLTSENCDMLNDTESNLTYSTATSTNPTWYSWTSAREIWASPPYNYAEYAVDSWNQYLTA
jgi:hypothetical protein